MAKSLVKHLTAAFKPNQFHDAYRENVERLLRQKKKGQEITTVEQPHKAPVIDLMEALKRSLAARNPAKSTPKTARTRKAPPRRKTAGRRKAA